MSWDHSLQHRSGAVIGIFLGCGMIPQMDSLPPAFPSVKKMHKNCSTVLCHCYVTVSFCRHNGDVVQQIVNNLQVIF